MTRFFQASEPQPGDDEPDEATLAKRSRRRRARSFTIRTLIVLIVAGVVAVLLRLFVVQPYYIPSESMEPTLHGCSGCSDDHVLVDKISYRFQDVKAGDVVVFHKPPNADVPDKVLVKRVIALAGDKVQLRRNAKGAWDGKVYVNGLPLDESYIDKDCPAPVTVPLTSTTSWTIPKGDVFVMGDNRCQSEDSRAFGPIKTSSIIGKAVLKIWPLSRFGRVK